MLCNSLWKNKVELLIKDKLSNELNLTYNEVDSLFNRNIFDIYGCLILDCTTDRSEEIEITHEQFEAVIAYNGDRTGYEYSCNEFRMVDYVDKHLNLEEQYILTKSYIEYLNSRLTLMTKRKILYILSIDGNILQMRFHQEWEGDRPYYDNNLETIGQPIAIFGSNDLSNNHTQICC